MRKTNLARLRLAASRLLSSLHDHGDDHLEGLLAMSAVPFTPEQQLRLLQVALRVKLRREGASPDAVKLAVSKLEVTERPPVALAA